MQPRRNRRRWTASALRVVSAPVLWWTRVPNVNRLDQTAWQRGKAEAAAISKHPVAHWLFVAVPGMTTALFTYDNWPCRLIAAFIAGTIGYAAVPLVWACVAAVLAPARQRNEARNHITASQKEHESAVAAVTRDGQQAVAGVQSDLAATQAELADVRNRVKCRHAVQEMEEAISPITQALERVLALDDPPWWGAMSGSGHLGKWAEHQPLFAATPNLKETHDALVRFYEDVASHLRAARAESARRRHPLAAALGATEQPDPEAGLRQARALLESSKAVRFRLADERDRLLREDPYA